jgi:hypothetical protein
VEKEERIRHENIRIVVVLIGHEDDYFFILDIFLQKKTVVRIKINLQKQCR